MSIVKMVDVEFIMEASEEMTAAESAAKESPLMMIGVKFRIRNG